MLFIRPIILCVLICVSAGCAAASRASAPQGDAELILNGDNTRMRFTFDRNQTITSEEADQNLADQEMCYLTIGKVTIECFPFGSLLMMGNNDAVELVFDNPLDDLHASSGDREGERLLRALSVASLIGASVERLPDALADYVDSDETLNPIVASTLAHQLMESREISIPGMSRVGPFKVILELTEDGKETLRSALADRETGNARFVHQRGAR